VMKITSVNVQTDMIDVSVPYEPDPDWIFVDALGKEHRWAYSANHRWYLPTLKQRSMPPEGERKCTHGDSPCPGALCWDCDEFVYETPGHSEWYVPETDEVVVPEYRNTMNERKFIPGCTTCEGEYESDELPKVGGTYNLEDCELLGTDKTIYGNIFISSADFEVSGVCHGTWRAVGDVTESARA